MQFFSQYKQDEILYNEVFGKNKGYFCEVGAHNGVKFSNTLFYEKHLNWNGICIEPLPDAFKSLKNNRKCIVKEGAAYNRTGTIKFIQCNGGIEMLSGIKETYGDQHSNRLEKEKQSSHQTSKEIDVSCFMLKNLFNEHKVDTVDYLSIDTEGSEYEVLLGIDFDKVKVNVVEIEVNYPDNEKHRSIISLLNSKGFQKWKKIVIDEIYISTNPCYSWQK